MSFVNLPEGLDPIELDDVIDILKENNVLLTGLIYGFNKDTSTKILVEITLQHT